MFNVTPGNYTFFADADGLQADSAVPVMDDGWTLVFLPWWDTELAANPTPAGCTSYAP